MPGGEGEGGWRIFPALFFKLLRFKDLTWEVLLKLQNLVININQLILRQFEM